MAKHECRACRGQVGDLVLDLGEQPACDYFPEYDEPGPDPVYPLQMWLCSSCGLAQLLDRSHGARGAQGRRARRPRRAGAGRGAPGRGGGPAARGNGRVAEYGSPHGGSWLGLLADRGLSAVDGTAKKRT